jgi:uncharacterized protein (DUF1919 family)
MSTYYKNFANDSYLVLDWAEEGKFQLSEKLLDLCNTIIGVQSEECVGNLNELNFQIEDEFVRLGLPVDKFQAIISNIIWDVLEYTYTEM